MKCPYCGKLFCGFETQKEIEIMEVISLIYETLKVGKINKKSVDLSTGLTYFKMLENIIKQRISND